LYEDGLNAGGLDECEAVPTLEEEAAFISEDGWLQNEHAFE
jgi:hypothetical protein